MGTITTVLLRQPGHGDRPWLLARSPRRCDCRPSGGRRSGE